MKVQDMCEPESFEALDGFPAAEAAGAVNQHGLPAVEGLDFRCEGGIADGEVHGTGQRIFGEFLCGA